MTGGPPVTRRLDLNCAASEVAALSAPEQSAIGR